MSAPAPAMLDIAFEIAGDTPERDSGVNLAAALEAALPWLVDEPAAGVHRLNLAAGNEPLLSRRTRLTLRVPRARAAAVEALSGRVLALQPGTLRLGRAHRRELLAHGTLYAHLVASDEDNEQDFLDEVGNRLAAIEASCRPICGRRGALAAGTVHGFSLMLDGLSGAAAMRVLEAGLGPHRRLGCGIFVPHRSASAVGAPP